MLLLFYLLLVQYYYYYYYYYYYTSRDSVAGIVTGYGLDDQGVGVRVPIASSIFASPRRPDWFWIPLNPLSNRYRGLFPWG
jgi:hypothetical protein